MLKKEKIHADLGRVREGLALDEMNVINSLSAVWAFSPLGDDA
jgi:hypothetical protein